MMRFSILLIMLSIILLSGCTDASEQSDVKSFDYDAWEKQADGDLKALKGSIDCALDGEPKCITIIQELTQGAYFKGAEGGEHISEVLVDIFIKNPIAFMDVLIIQSEEVKVEVAGTLISPVNDKYTEVKFVEALKKCDTPIQDEYIKKVFEAYKL